MDAVLKVSFENYIYNVCKLTKNTAIHYTDALNNISTRLRNKGMVETDIYEIRDLDTLLKAQQVLLQDNDFMALNSRGHSMYSAGLNNYIKFAKGKDFASLTKGASALDVAVPASQQTKVTQHKWQRSDIIRTQAIELAQHQCEIDAGHETFVARVNHKQYMEGHHAIPLHHQAEFGNSLDVYANVLCLCPLCHRKLHHGLDAERNKVLDYVYGMRHERLAASGLDVSEKDFLALAMG